MYRKPAVTAAHSSPPLSNHLQLPQQSSSSRISTSAQSITTTMGTVTAQSPPSPHPRPFSSQSRSPSSRQRRHRSPSSSASHRQYSSSRSRSPRPHSRSHSKQHKRRSRYHDDVHDDCISCTSSCSCTSGCVTNTDNEDSDSEAYEEEIKEEEIEEEQVTPQPQPKTKSQPKPESKQKKSSSNQAIVTQTKDAASPTLTPSPKPQATKRSPTRRRVVVSPPQPVQPVVQQIEEDPEPEEEPYEDDGVEITFSNPRQEDAKADPLNALSKDELYKSALASITRAEIGFHTHILTQVHANQTQATDSMPAPIFQRKLLRYEPRKYRHAGRAVTESHTSGSGNLAWYALKEMEGGQKPAKIKGKQAADDEVESKMNVLQLTERNESPSGAATTRSSSSKHGVHLTLSRKEGIIPLRRIRAIRRGYVEGAVKLISLFNNHFQQMDIDVEKEGIRKETCISLLMENKIHHHRPNGEQPADPLTEYDFKHLQCVATFEPRVCPRVPSSFDRANQAASWKMRKEIHRNRRKQLGKGVVNRIEDEVEGDLDPSTMSASMGRAQHAAAMMYSHSLTQSFPRSSSQPRLHSSPLRSSSATAPSASPHNDWIVISLPSVEEATMLLNALVALKMIAGKNVQRREVADDEEQVWIPNEKEETMKKRDDDDEEQKTARLPPEQLTDALLGVADSISRESVSHSLRRSPQQQQRSPAAYLKRASVPTPHVRAIFDTHLSPSRRGMIKYPGREESKEPQPFSSSHRTLYQPRLSPTPPIRPSIPLASSHTAPHSIDEWLALKSQAERDAKDKAERQAAEKAFAAEQKKRESAEALVKYRQRQATIEARRIEAEKKAAEKARDDEMRKKILAEQRKAACLNAYTTFLEKYHARLEAEQAKTQKKAEKTAAEERKKKARASARFHEWLKSKNEWLIRKQRQMKERKENGAEDDDPKEEQLFDMKWLEREVEAEMAAEAVEAAEAADQSEKKQASSSSYTSPRIRSSPSKRVTSAKKSPAVRRYPPSSLHPPSTVAAASSSFSPSTSSSRYQQQHQHISFYHEPSHHEAEHDEINAPTDQADMELWNRLMSNLEYTRDEIIRLVNEDEPTMQARLDQPLNSQSAASYHSFHDSSSPLAFSSPVRGVPIHDTMQVELGGSAARRSSPQRF